MSLTATLWSATSANPTGFRTKGVLEFTDPSGTLAAPAFLSKHFTKKTAFEMFVCLWMRSEPELLRPALDIISCLLMVPTVPGAQENVLECVNQVQQTASLAFKDMCFGGAESLQDAVPNLAQLYIGKVALPIRIQF